MNALVQLIELKKYYPVRTGLGALQLHAVDGVSLTISEGETVGLVGESGSGKSTLGKCVLRLEEPTSGKILFADEDVTKTSATRLRQLRKSIQIVFQDPLGSLNPRLTVGQIVSEPLRIHGIAKDRGDAIKRATELFDLVGLKPNHLIRYPHQLSGGQQQRVSVARALATQPRFIVLDEPTSSLDVSIQAQILHLLQHLQQEFKLAYLFISHDLSVVSTMARRIAVMYLGQIVELGPAREVFGQPRHPYTRALLSAIPRETPAEEKTRIRLTGEVVSAIQPPSGCRLASRCPFAEGRCFAEAQPLLAATPEHFVRCWKWDRVDPSILKSKPDFPSSVLGGFR